MSTSIKKAPKDIYLVISDDQSDSCWSYDESGEYTIHYVKAELILKKLTGYSTLFQKVDNPENPGKKDIKKLIRGLNEIHKLIHGLVELLIPEDH
jgi:hypothetical protein